MIRNASVQLTVSGGRITSLWDVALEYVSSYQTWRSFSDVYLHSPGASSSLRARPEAW